MNALASPLLSFNSRQIVDQLTLLRLPALIINLKTAKAL